MIKKSITIFFLFFLLSNNSYSQKLEFGLKGGTNFATQKLNGISGVESITGYHIGGFLYIALAIAILCFFPTDNFCPRSPIIE